MNTKRLLAAILALFLTLTTASALAMGRVTPETPTDAQAHATFRGWVDETLMPYLLEMEID